MPRRKFAWEKLSDDELLKQRLSSLRVTVEGTWLEGCVSTLYEELEERDIRLRPHTWMSSEWFSPGGVPGIAIPGIPGIPAIPGMLAMAALSDAAFVVAASSPLPEQATHAMANPTTREMLLVVIRIIGSCCLATAAWT